MTPKEKALELIEKMSVIHYVKLGGKNSERKGLPVSMHDSQIKQCALNCVEEIISNCCTYVSNLDANWITDEETSEYWVKVKEEILKYYENR